MGEPKVNVNVDANTVYQQFATTRTTLETTSKKLIEKLTIEERKTLKKVFDLVSTQKINIPDDVKADLKSLNDRLKAIKEKPEDHPRITSSLISRITMTRSKALAGRFAEIDAGKAYLADGL